MKKKRQYHFYIAGGVVVLFVFAFTLTGKAQTSFLDNVAERVAGKVSAVIADALLGQISSVEDTFGAIGTRFPSGLGVGPDVTISQEGEFIASATSTLQEITYGDRYVKTVAAGSVATSTGGLAKITNTKSPMYCSWELDITGAADEGGAQISISTSTSATAFSASNTGGLIASTTFATGTTPFFNAYDSGQGSSGMRKFLFDSGNTILATLGFTDTRASTTSYDTMSAKLHLTDCHTK